MEIAITGISGHIGNNVARALRKNGHELKALVQNVQADSLKGIDATYIQGDLFNKDALDDLLKEADFLIHIAGKISMDSKHRDEIYNVNIEGVNRVIEACKRNKVNNILHFSSIHAHIPLGREHAMNEKTPYITEEDVAYDYSKSIGEQLMLQARSSGINVSIVNPTAVIGPFDFSPSLSGKMIMDVYTGKLKSLVKGGFDWVDVRDIAKATVAIVERNIVNEKFILSGHWMEFKELGDLICSVKGSRYKGFISPISLAKIGLPFIAVWAKVSGTQPLYNYESLKTIEEGSMINDHTNARKLIDYYPRPLEETIYDSIKWFEQNNFI